MAKLDDMMGAMGGMPAADKAPASERTEKPADDTGEVSEEEMGYAEDMGFDAGKAKALKRFIRSCMASEESGEYESDAGDTGEEMGEL